MPTANRRRRNTTIVDGSRGQWKSARIGLDTAFTGTPRLASVSEDLYSYEPIGVIRTPFESATGMPIQPVGDAGSEGTIEIAESYTDELEDLDGFSHCILLYHFHASSVDGSLKIEPFLDEERRGVFATRAPQRPNPIGLSVVQIVSVTAPAVTVSGIDVIDGTPLLDIKPFVPAFDVPADVETGWLDASRDTVRSTRADDRFRR